MKSTPRTFLPVLIHIKDAYTQWQFIFNKLPKTTKYSIGLKIDNLFTETIEAVATATFLQKIQKLPYIKKANVKIDTIKVFFQILWDMKTIETKRYA